MSALKVSQNVTTANCILILDLNIRIGVKNILVNIVVTLMLSC